MKRIFVLLVILTVFGLSGCAMDMAPTKDYENSDDWEDVEDDIPSYDKGFDPSDEAGGEILANNDTPALENRKIIYEADLNMISTDPEALYQNIVSKLEEYNAYFESEDINEQKYSITIRVLSDNLMDFVNEIKGQGEVLSYSKSSRDVTNEYSRFEAEYQALQTQYDLIYGLLQDATELNDIYNLSNKLAELETDLNQIGLMLTTYDSLVDYSTINLEIVKIENLESLMDVSIKPIVSRESYDTNSIAVNVRNTSSNTATFYIVVKQNGEEVTSISKVLISEQEETVLFTDLDSDTQYKFEVYATEEDHLTSAASVIKITTERTYGSTLSNTFTGSINSLVTIFQWLLIAFLAIIPYAVILSVIAVPTWLLYKKYGIEK